MAVDSLLTGLLSVPAGLAFPPYDAPPAARLAWCIRFSTYCGHQARLAREFDLPTRQWLRAAEFAAYAGSIWAERLADPAMTKGPAIEAAEPRRARV